MADLRQVNLQWAGAAWQLSPTLRLLQFDVDTLLTTPNARGTGGAYHLAQVPA